MAEQTRSVVVAEFKDGIQPGQAHEPQPSQTGTVRAPEAKVHLGLPRRKIARIHLDMGERWRELSNQF